jgi:phage baseplate assembly protein W
MAAIRRAELYSPLSLKKVVYADFDTEFNPQPSKKDLTVFFNEDAVKRSIRNLLLTNRGERLFNPYIGSSISKNLFENIGPGTESAIQSAIQKTIENFEKRAQVIQVIVSAVPELNTYTVRILFSIYNKEDPIVLDILLDRTR